MKINFSEAFLILPCPSMIHDAVLEKFLILTTMHSIHNHCFDQQSLHQGMTEACNKFAGARALRQFQLENLWKLSNLA